MTILSPTTKTATVRSTFGRSPLTVHYGGDYIDPGEILLDEPRHGHYDGVALRDALLEAFPLEEKVILHETEKKPDAVPGMVFKDKGDSLRVALSGDSWFVVDSGRTWTTAEVDRSLAPWNLKDEVVFDPRDAVALPSPLGIRVGDRVRKVYKDGDVTTTVEFEVHLLENGLAHPRYGVAYGVRDLAVTSREVPDRLPAGTITRQRSTGEVRLRTQEGWINLSSGQIVDRLASEAFENDLRGGRTEVIYLPES